MSFRILSLDGGGSWSLLQIMTLIDLYRSGGALLSGHHVLHDFDLVVASGSGSIVLGGLVKDLPLVDIRKFFEDEAQRRTLFAAPRTRPTMRERLLRHLTGTAPRYSARGKFDGLRHLLNSESGEPGIGDVTLDALKTRIDVPTQLMIAAYDYDRQREIVFRSNIQSAAADFGAPAIATLAEAVHAATTAPLGFFDAPASVSRGRRCWDGALAGANNPVLVAVAEALASGVEPASIEVLSLGTGSVILPMAGGNEDSASAKLVRQRIPAGEAGDLRKLADTLLDDPPDTATFTAYLALGHAVPASGERLTAGRLVRMNPLVQPIRLANGWVRPAGLNEAEDDGDEFVRLRELPVDAVDADDIALIQKLGALWHGDAVVNQPVRANSDTLDCEVGQRWYNEAKAQWLTLTGGQGAGAAAGPTAATTAWSGSRFTGSKMG